MVKKQIETLMPVSSTTSEASILPIRKTRKTRLNGFKVVIVAKSSLLSSLFFVILLLTIYTVRQIKIELIRVQSNRTTCSNKNLISLEEVIVLASSLQQNRSNANENNFTGFLSSNLLQDIHSKKYDNTIFLLHTEGSRQQKLVEIGQSSPQERQQRIDNLIGIHNHSIPPIITFTHRYDLLTDNFSFYKKDAKTMKDYENDNDNDELTVKQREILAYHENVQNIIQLHPESTIRFLNDNDCVISIYNVMKKLYNNSDIVAYKMIQYFLNEPDGSFKGDLCRGVALYETGGIYLDVDIAMRHSIWKSIQPETEFASPYCHFSDWEAGGFFQAFIGVTQYHPVIERYIRLFYGFYQGTIPNIAEIQTGLYGVKLLKRAYLEVLREQQYQYEIENATQIILKILPSNNTNSNIVNTRRRLQVQVSKTSEIWYEIVYNKKIFFPTVQRPQWGNSPTCQVVVASRKRTEYKSLVNLIKTYTKIIKYDKNNTEAYTTLQSLLQEQDYSVPMYSRIAYSHRCPMK